MDYLDLYLIHWPVALKHGVGFPKSAAEFGSLEDVRLLETWNAMIERKRSGLARHVGVANFNELKLMHLTESNVEKPEMNQVEMHPYLTQAELVDYARSAGIGLTAYSPLGSNDRPERIRGNRPVLLENEVVVAIAKAHDVTPAQVLIAFLNHRGVAAIPKSANKERIRQNL